MSRAELQANADARLGDAQTLLDAGRWSGAYYLAGYAVELALKSCVLAHIEKTGVIFKNKDYANSLGNKIWVHDLAKLADAANLTDSFDAESKANHDFGSSWAVVKKWDETTRYNPKSEEEAKELLEAITHDVNGVLPWLRTRW